MRTDFYIKEGDRAPFLEAIAIDEDGEIVDLTAAVGVTFSMNNPGDDAPKIESSAASIVAPATQGLMRYQWGASDTEDPGNYDGEFEVEWSDGTKTTFPNFRFLRIKITRSIDTSD